MVPDRRTNSGYANMQGRAGRRALVVVRVPSTRAKKPVGLAFR
jgi:hypothetical protein